MPPLTKELPFIESSGIDQLITVISAFALKPAYMVFSLILILVLEKSILRELKILRWGLIAFLAGEIFCAINYLFYQEESWIVEYLHSWGMAACFSLTIFSLVEFTDAQLLQYSVPDKKCALLHLCRKCPKNTDAACKLHAIFKFLIIAFILIGFIPLLVELTPVSYNTMIYGTQYNYKHLEINQWNELRLLPCLGMFSLVVSFFIFVTRRGNFVQSAKIWFCAGAGLLGFSMFRLVLFFAYRNNLTWFVFWEELTEMLYILSIALFLYQFRESVFRKNILVA